MGQLDDLKDPGDTTADPGGAGFVDEGTTAGAKHVVVGVEHFAPEVGSATMSTYLRLGTPLPRAERGRISGDDLASLVQGFNDDTRDRGTAGQSPPTPETFDASSAALFSRAYPGHDPTTIDPRRVESAILQEKGGWRDHTDGNRITTTRGDKVEVIQGNYKLVVLGRQTNDGITSEGATALDTLLNNSAGFDISGGQNDLAGDAAFASQPDPLTPAADASRDQTALAMSWEWQEDSDGTFSWTQTTISGAEHPDATVPGNYRIQNLNYVDYQEDNFGTADGRVSQITTSTYAGHMETKMDVAGTNKTTMNGGTVENTNIAGFILTHNAVAAMEEVDAAVFITLIQLAPLVNGSAYFGGVATFDPLCADFHIGPHLDMHVGPHFDLHSLFHVEVHVGPHIDAHLGTHTDLQMLTHTTVGAHMSDEEYTFNNWTVNTTSGVITYTGPGGRQTVSTTPTTNVNAAGSNLLAPHARE